MAEGIIGRQGELAALDDFLEAAGEWPRGLFFEGPAGIGKTRLWREGLERARARHLRVLASRPGGAEVQLGFAGIADLLRDVLEDVLAELPSPQRRALAVALLLEDAEGAAPDDRAVAAAFLGALRTLAATGPVVVAVDDMQWLDAASARTLAFALRRLEDEPIGVLGTIRVSPEEADPVELVRSLAHERLSRVPLGPLSVGALYELVQSRLGTQLHRSTLLHLHETSAGNPFFALELARALQAAGREPATGDPLPVPVGLRELVEGRLARLSPRAQEALLVASALNQPTVGLVQDSDAVAEAVEAGVVELDGDSIRFTHPLLASIHYASAPPERRRDIHPRLAELITDPEERARHRGLGDRRDGRECGRGRSRLRRAAHATAARSCRCRAHGRRPEPDARFGAGCSAAASPRGGRGALRRGRSRARARDRSRTSSRGATAGPERAEVLWSIGKIKFEGEDTRVGLDYFQRALAEAGDDDLLRARILDSLSLSAVKQQGFRSRAGVRAAGRRRSPSGWETSRRWPARSPSSATSSSCATRDCETELFERAVALEDELGGLELDYGPSARYARALYDAGSYEHARPLLERLIERGRRLGDAAVNMPLFLLANIELETGDWASAEKHCGRRTTSRSRPAARLPSREGCSRSRGSRLRAGIRKTRARMQSRRLS